MRMASIHDGGTRFGAILSGMFISLLWLSKYAPHVEEEPLS